MINKNKKIKAFSTSALTTLLGALLVVTNISSSSATTSSDSTFDASASVASSCIISATAMTFSAYTETLITATTDVTANCTYGTTGTITLTTVADATTTNYYKLVRVGGSASTVNDVLEVSFKKTSDSTALYSGSGSFSVTGTGSAVTSSALITGTIAASQTAKTAGTFSKSLTLTVTY